MNIISGEKIQQLANIYLGFAENFQANPLIEKEKSKQVVFSSITKPFENPYLVFCYSHNVKSLSNIIDFFNNDFILITHNSDENIYLSPEVEKILHNKKLKKWYTQNLCFFHEKIHFLPIGIANSQWPHGDLTLFNKEVIDSSNDKIKKVYFNFNINTNYDKRYPCYTSLKNKLEWLENISPKDNLLRLKNYQFCICPEGNGVDTHRLWESLYLKVVPIVVTNNFIQILERNKIPLVILSSWDDFDESLLDYSNFCFDNLSITMDHYLFLFNN